ncbi:MAG: carboxypeptidase-like regulatory domain-containing protein, partial [Bacteroidota bacterium]
MRLNLFINLFILFFGSHLNAQKSFIRGTVFDANSGEFLPGVTVVVEEDLSIGTITDLDGKFSLNISPGSYNLRISFVSYETIIISDVQVKENEVTSLDDIGLREATLSLSETVITAEAVRNTETAMLTMKRKSANLVDGVSAASFKKIGDSDAASSMKRVTGVSVEGGKYIFVRGLGDRYTKTILNGLDIPGLDPDRNSLQMDIFPTNVIDNIVVHKSFSATLPA